MRLAANVDSQLTLSEINGQLAHFSDMRRRLCIGSLAICLLLAPRTGAAADAPRNTKPFTRFKVLLGGILNDTLPFDVPFIIWGDVEESMSEEIGRAEVTLWSAELRAGTSCDGVARRSYVRIARSPVAKWTETNFRDRGIDLPTDADAAKRRQFEMLIPALEPRRIYCFLFQISPGRAPNGPEAAALGASILPAYQEFLRKRGVVKALDEEEAEPLRQDLIQAMITSVPLGGMTPRPGTVFDPKADAAAVAGPFRISWIRVQTQHNRVVDQLRRFQDFSAGSRNAENLQDWITWSRSEPFRNLAAAASIPADVASEMRNLRVLRDDQIMRRFVGLPADAPDEPVTDLWQPDSSIGEPASFSQTDPCPVVPPLSARCTEVERTIAVLSRLADAVGASSPIRDQIRETIDDLGERKVNILTTQDAINRRHREILAHIRELQALIPSDWTTLATTEGNLATRRAWYVSSDTGLAVAFSINEILPYTGANVYVRPVNTEAPPGKFLTRFSFLVGFSWTDNILKPGERAALYGDSASLLLGAGVRLTEVIKLSGGVITFKGIDPNPTINKTKIQVTPFVSFSGDIDMAKLLGGLFGSAAEPPTIGAGTPPKR